MTEQVISFETAKLAKEKGFNIDSFYFYTKPNSKVFGIDEHGRNYPIINKPKTLFVVGNAVALNIKNVYLAPTQSLLQKWLRDVHNIDVWSQPFVHQPEDLTKKPYLPDESYSYFIYKDGSWMMDKVDCFDWESALEEGLQKALKLI